METKDFMDEDYSDDQVYDGWGRVQAEKKLKDLKKELVDTKVELILTKVDLILTIVEHKQLSHLTIKTFRDLVKDSELEGAVLQELKNRHIENIDLSEVEKALKKEI